MKNLFQVPAIHNDLNQLLLIQFLQVSFKKKPSSNYLDGHYMSLICLQQSFDETFNWQTYASFCYHACICLLLEDYAFFELGSPC